MVQSGGESGGVPGVGQAVPVAAQTAAYGTPTAVKPRAGAIQPVPVKRESLTQILSLDGTVAARAQEPITYAWRAVVDDVKVKPGQSVQEGDTLVAFSQGDIPKTLDTARAHLQTSLGNLALAQAQAQSSQAATAQRMAAEQQKRHQAELDAQLALSRAQANLIKVQAGRSATEKQVADTAVTDYGTTKLATAQRALDVALAGPDENTIRLAQREVASSQLVLTKAQNDLDTLTRGADPAALRNAQAAVQRAQSQLQIAQTAKLDPKAPDLALAKLQHDSAIQDAQVALDNAQAEIAKLKQPPSDGDVQTARFHVLDAQTSLASAEAKLETLLAGPDPATVEAAQHDLEVTRHALSEVQAIRDEVYSHPTPAELQQAEDQVRAAQTAFDNARQATPEISDATPDLGALEKVIGQDQADVAAAEQALQNTLLRAPFDGTVVSVKTKPGDIPVPSKPVVIMSKPGAPIVRVDLDDAQAAQLALGQSATAHIGTGASAVSANATVTTLLPAAQDGSMGAGATFEVTWPESQAPRFGTPIQMTVNLGEKPNVLVIPKSAVHQTGGRATVEVQDGTLRHVVRVQVGITTADSVEILSGLTEGQMVLAAPA